MSKISREEVINVANLARLRLSEEEIKKMQSDMSSILDFISQINELDTTGIEPSAHAIDIKNVFREDVIVPPLDRDKLLKLAPESNNGFIVVPKVIG